MPRYGSAVGDVVNLVAILLGLLFLQRKRSRADDAEETFSATGILKPIPESLRKLPEVVAGRVGLMVLVAVVIIVIPLVAGPGDDPRVHRRPHLRDHRHLARGPDGVVGQREPGAVRLRGRRRRAGGRPDREGQRRPLPQPRRRRCGRCGAGRDRRDPRAAHPRGLPGRGDPRPRGGDGHLLPQPDLLPEHHPAGLPAPHALAALRPGVQQVLLLPLPRLPGADDPLHSGVAAGPVRAGPAGDPRQRKGRGRHVGAAGAHQAGRLRAGGRHRRHRRRALRRAAGRRRLQHLRPLLRAGGVLHGRDRRPGLHQRRAHGRRADRGAELLVPQVPAGVHRRRPAPGPALPPRRSRGGGAEHPGPAAQDRRRAPRHPGAEPGGRQAGGAGRPRAGGDVAAGARAERGERQRQRRRRRRRSRPRSCRCPTPATRTPPRCRSRRPTAAGPSPARRSCSRASRSRSPTARSRSSSGSTSRSTRARSSRCSAPTAPASRPCSRAPAAWSRWVGDQSTCRAPGSPASPPSRSHAWASR